MALLGLIHQALSNNSQRRPKAQAVFSLFIRLLYLLKKVLFKKMYCCVPPQPYFFHAFFLSGNLCICLGPQQVHLHSTFIPLLSVCLRPFFDLLFFTDCASRLKFPLFVSSSSFTYQFVLLNITLILKFSQYEY